MPPFNSCAEMCGQPRQDTGYCDDLASLISMLHGTCSMICMSYDMRVLF